MRTTRSPGTHGKGKPGSSMVHLQLIPPSPQGQSYGAAIQNSFDSKKVKKKKRNDKPNSRLMKQRHSSHSQPKSP